MKSFFEILLTFLKLGLTSFGGPVAHLGFFRDELVDKRKWIGEAQYADVIALCQFLPGPASSQVGFTLGLFRGGWAGGVAAWLGFTLPSAIFLTLCAYGFTRYTDGVEPGWLTGLKVAAVAVVANALWGMAVNLCPDLVRRLMAFLAAALLVLVPHPASQLGVILAGAATGLFLISGEAEHKAHEPFPWTPAWKVSMACLVLFFGLLIGLPLLSRSMDVLAVDLFDSFYRAGALVFGGGHVVLPLLETEVVRPGWVSAESFLGGYGAAQAVPGPLFTFASFLGASLDPQLWHAPAWAGSVLCLVAIFLSTWLLVPAALPFWDRLRAQPKAQGALAGANAVVVGLLLAALYDPVWIRGISSPGSFALVLVCYFLLAVVKVPAWGVVVLAALSGGFFF
ncbi:MAG: chromate efflux transporter [Verrucomicrobiota bacterium]